MHAVMQTFEVLSAIVGIIESRDVKFARKFFLAFLAYLATYLENYKSDHNLKSIKAQYNYFVIKYIIW